MFKDQFTLGYSNTSSELGTTTMVGPFFSSLSILSYQKIEEFFK
jgi:hypothetical protein